MTRAAAFNTGPEFHGLDHIVPIAHALDIPLIVTEPLNLELSQRYYPQVTPRFMPDLEFKLGQVAEEFDVLFECKYWAPHLKALFKRLYNKDMRLVFCPHGQSDKGYKAPLLAPYAMQDAVLVYGDLMIQMLKDLSVWQDVQRYAIVGNYRLCFYQEHQKFYDALVEKEIPLDRKKKTLLYAPTWKDADSATSFFKVTKKLIEELPSNWNLIVKLHPMLEQRNPAEYEAILAFAEKKKEVFWLDRFPLVYPLLSKVDLFLGDASSVGYDFLFYKKPLYFFGSGGRLHSCGKELDPAKNLYLQMDGENEFMEEQKALYKFAFEEKSDLKKSLIAAEFL